MKTYAGKGYHGAAFQITTINQNATLREAVISLRSQTQFGA